MVKWCKLEMECIQVNRKYYVLIIHVTLNHLR